MVADEFLPVLSALAPCFEHPADGVSFIYSPTKFHSTVIDMISSSQHTLLISSLYIGCGAAHNNELSKEIVAAIRKRLASAGPSFKLRILVDGTRSNRPCDNSAIVLRQLEIDYPTLDIEVHPMFVKDNFSFLLRRLPGGSEATSRLQHMKYIVADEDIIVTGANLSEEYFTTRKDRYVLIKGAKGLSEFYSKLTMLAIEATSEYINKTSNVQAKLVDLLELDKMPRLSELSPDKVYLFPSIQIPWLNIRHEEALVTTILAMARNLDISMHLSTAYFNIASQIKSFFIHKPASASASISSVITAAPMCNSFFNADWPKNLVPDVYESLLDQFSLSTSVNVRVLQYSRPGWTFHAKGLYLQLKDHVFLTQIGSSNYGNFIWPTNGIGGRSFDRDLECQLTMLTCNPGLQKEFAKVSSCLTLGPC